MMESKRMILEEFTMDFDLNRIRYLALPEKFKLLNHIRLVATEAERARLHGIKSLEQSEHYSVNKTYNLFALLLVENVPYEVLKDIVRNYALHFEKSDTYYAQIAVLGMGVMMIQQGFTQGSILSFLMHLLGDEFLLDNLKYQGVMPAEDIGKFEFDSQIVYKPFEGNMRRLKYDMMAMLRIRDTKGLDTVRKIICDSYGDAKLRLFFNMMETASPDVMEYMAEEWKETPPTEDRLKAYGAYALLKGWDVYSTHYVFNSVIGKYSRFDKDSSEIEQELEHRLDEILVKAGMK